MKDEEVAALLTALAKSGRSGLKGLFLVQNEFGPLTVEAIANAFVCSDSIKQIDRLVIKKSVGVEFKAINMSMIFQ